MCNNKSKYKRRNFHKKEQNFHKILFYKIQFFSHQNCILNLINIHINIGLDFEQIFIVDSGTSAQIFPFEGKLVKDIHTCHRTSQVANTFQSEDQKCGNQNGAGDPGRFVSPKSSGLCEGVHLWIRSGRRISFVTSGRSLCGIFRDTRRQATTQRGPSVQSNWQISGQERKDKVYD